MCINDAGVKQLIRRVPFRGGLKYSYKIHLLIFYTMGEGVSYTPITSLKIKSSRPFPSFSSFFFFFRGYFKSFQ